MRVFKKIASLILVLSMVLVAAGCGSSTTWVYKAGENTVTAGFYMTSHIIELSNFINEVTTEVEFPQGENLTTYKEFLDYEYNGKTGYDTVLEKTEERCRTYFATLDEFSRLGLSIDPTTEKNMVAYAGQAWDSQKAFFESNGVSRESYGEFNLDNMRRETLFAALYGVDGELAPPEQELEAYYLENFAKAELVEISLQSTSPEETRTPEEFEAEMRDLAEDYKEQIALGASSEGLQYQHEVLMAGPEGAAEVQEYPEGALGLIVSEGTKDFYSQYGMLELADQIIATKGKEPYLYELEGQKVLFIIVPRSLEIDENYETYRPSVLEEKMLPVFEEHLIELGKAVTLESNKAALKRYQPNKVKEQAGATAPASSEESSADVLA